MLRHLSRRFTNKTGVPAWFPKWYESTPNITQEPSPVITATPRGTVITNKSKDDNTDCVIATAAVVTAITTISHHNDYSNDNCDTNDSCDSGGGCDGGDGGGGGGD